MEFLDELTEGLDRVLMVRGEERKVITFYLWGHLSLLWLEKGHHAFEKLFSPFIRMQSGAF